MNQRKGRKIALAINIQSFIDVITNSSTELFICDTQKSAETVDEMLKAMGIFGYENPWVFSIKEYTKSTQDENNTGINVGFEKDYRYNNLARWFYNPDSSADVIDARMTYIKDVPAFDSPYEHLWKGKEYNERQPIYNEIYNTINKMAEEDQPDWWKDPFSASTYHYDYDARNFDGHIIVMGIGDNDIPYESFDQIQYTFNAVRIHMG